VTHLIAITAVGSLQENILPLDIVIPDQLIDRTYKRESTFFGDGLVAHIPFAEPFCPVLSDLLFQSASSITARVHKGGTLVSIEGPAFSTKAESRLYQKWGIDIIGMTTLQEAKLAREAEICYAAMAMVTDYDCWREESEAVSVKAVLSNLEKNTNSAKKIIHYLVPQIAGEQNCDCAHSLKDAIMTQRECISEDTRQRLLPLIKKYLIK
jgi:5'-methylthioadenosine phosphorylase